ncbi:MAG: Hsp20 family protein [Bdellovibrionales bacterium]|nr:Hsp20 family protein [Bdellovibrionales bacterium]
MYYPTTLSSRYGVTSPNRLMRMVEEMLEPRLTGMGDLSEVSSQIIPTNVRETEDKYIVEAQMSGADREDIEVFLEDDVLTVSYDAKTEEEQLEGGVLQDEWRLESRRRSMRLPQVDRKSEPVGTLQNGILRVEVEKSPERRRRRLTIQ